MLAIQGSIQELQRFATLRDEVNQKAKEAKDAKSNSNNQ
jgi:glutaredoxin-related protein